jgi:Domain of unknown function (DUF3418)
LEQLEHYRWMLEEYRVSLFAQEVWTKVGGFGQAAEKVVE